MNEWETERKIQIDYAQICQNQSHRQTKRKSYFTTTATIISIQNREKKRSQTLTNTVFKQSRTKKNTIHTQSIQSRKLIAPRTMYMCAHSIWDLVQFASILSFIYPEFVVAVCFFWFDFFIVLRGFDSLRWLSIKLRYFGEQNQT